MHHLLDETPIKFESSQSVERAGLLVLLPFLQANGLFSFKSHYEELKRGYYYISFIIQLLAYMYLSRIKNPEQLKLISPGELGKVMGIDRVPETRCLRNKLKEICNQNKSKDWNIDLENQWVNEDGNGFYYINGHVQVYSGYSASLGKKHIARQRLCLPGVQEFWVNNEDGLPYFYVTGQVNEKLLEMLSISIIPQLLNDIKHKISNEELASDKDLPIFTIVFDREGYSPQFFGKIWDDYRVAVLTYRKNVKDSWAESEFKDYEIEIAGNKEVMKLAEKQVRLNNVEMREIRKLSEGGHQTSIITTNRKLSKLDLAKKMFSRWTQENYFKYMRKEYDFDRLLQYVVKEIDSDFVVSNPEYNNLSYHLKKIREKINRRKAKLYELISKNSQESFENTSKEYKKQAKEQLEIDYLLEQETDLINKRSSLPSRIKVKDMPEHLKYNRLDIESKHFQNIIKMICYRSESNCSNILSEYYNRADDEKRALVKAIINSRGDIISDEEQGTLTVRIYTLPNERMNRALEKLLEILNEGEHKYPDTNLRLIYTTAKSNITKGKEF